MTSRNKTQLCFQIVAGPSKFDLMVSLFDGNKPTRRTVNFRLQQVREPIEVAITAVQQENGSGESWNFEGLLWHRGERHYKVCGYFATSGRVGTIEFETPFNNSWNQDTNQFEKLVNPTELAELERFLAELQAQ